jgi:hypothetical protein
MRRSRKMLKRKLLLRQLTPRRLTVKSLRSLPSRKQKKALRKSQLPRSHRKPKLSKRPSLANSDETSDVTPIKAIKSRERKVRSLVRQSRRKPRLPRWKLTRSLRGDSKESHLCGRKRSGFSQKLNRFRSEEKNTG